MTTVSVKMNVLSLFSIGLVLLTTLTWAAPVQNELSIYMPAVKPLKNDSYICHGVKLGKSAQFINEFIPKADMGVAHHMLLYGCTEPGSDAQSWDCGEMTDSSANHICKSEKAILYAWAMDAPKFKLPEGITFKVGGDTPIKSLVLQVHYKNARSFLPPSKKTDSSGIKLRIQSTPTAKFAGMYLLASDGMVPPHSSVYFDIACTYNGRPTMHPFAFRTHTHKLGQVVSGFRVRDGRWTEIGRESPQKPQMFYAVKKPGLAIRQGDTLAARCVMQNNGSKVVRVGATQNDEMCNFYIMYWIDAEDARYKNSLNGNCASSGFPSYSWKLEGFPDIPANSAMLPNSSKMFRMSEEIEKSIDQGIYQIEQDLQSELANLERYFLKEESVDSEIDGNLDSLSERYGDTEAEKNDDGDGYEGNEGYFEKNMEV